MPTIQFDPKITTDLSINWQRASSGQASDMFADLLADRMKQTVEADRRQPAPKRSQPASDPLSGRPSRIVVAHPRTARGEAKELDQTAARLKDDRQCAKEETSAEASDETAVITDNADDTQQPETAEAPAETEAAATATEESVAAADQPAQSADPAAAVVVPTQHAEQTEASGSDQELTLAPELPESAAGDNLVPEEGEAAPSAQDGSQQGAEDAMEQQAVEGMVEASLSDITAAPTSDDAAPTVDAGAPVVATQPTAVSKAAVTAEQPLLQTLVTPQPITEPAPQAAQPQADRRAADVKIRPNASRPAVNTADPKPGTLATASSSALPHQAAPLQPSTDSEFDGLADPFDQPFSSEGTEPGWLLHLAQGAAGKRPDFVAQLRQHLQNLPAHEQVAVHIQRALRDGTGKFSVELSPAELGRIQVKLQIDEDKRVTASVTVERSSTLELLQRDIKGLERALHNAGLSLESGDLSFSLGQGSDRDFAQDLNHSAASTAGARVSDGEAEGEQPGGAADQVMDTAAGVVNLQV